MKHERITSRHNHFVKEIRDLKKRAARDELGLAFVEGRRLVQEAINATGPGLGNRALIKTICVSESYAEDGGLGEYEIFARGGGIRFVVLADDVFESVSDTIQPQGVLAIIRMYDYKLSDLIERGNEAGTGAGPRRLLMLDRVSDPGNVGAMLRTAWAAGFTGAILSADCADIYGPKTMRAAMGAVFHLTFIRDADIMSAANELKNAGYSIYASVAPMGANEPKDCFEAGISAGDAAIIIGSEAFGVDPNLLRICDCALTIPMPGGAESLNAGVAAGILMYEFLRRSRARR